jgi:hypothetical protein
MTRVFITRIFTIMIALIVLAATNDGYSQKKSKREKLPKGTVRLEYKFIENKPISYLSSTKMVEAMEFEGQSFEVNVNLALGCTIKTTGKQDKNLKLEVRVDTLYQYVETPQGSAGGNNKDVQGKVFNMILSPFGAEVDLSEAEKITFTEEGSGETNLAQSFINYFPDLPKKPVKPGDKWTANDTIKSKSSSTSVSEIVQSDNTYQGIEKIDGVDYAKITATLTGSRDQTAQTMGMDVHTKVTFTGTEELYFAIKEGYYLKEVVNSKMKGTVDITGDQNMSFPVTIDMVSTNSLKK